MTALATRTIQKKHQRTKTLTTLQKVAERDKIPVKDCIDTYGNFIWALAKNFTSSREEAEAAAREIFLDIRRYSERTDKTQSAKEKLIAMIALRRLIKQLQ